MIRTILDACLDATDAIWDDREAYIRAVLDLLRIDPEADYEDFCENVVWYRP